LQVRDGIRHFIADRGLKPGDPFPSEQELATSFEVSRPTLREALRLLEQDGVLDVRPGNGRFLSVLPTIQRPITRLEGMTELLQEIGYRVSDRVLSLNVRPASSEECSALRLEPNSEVIHLERMRLQDDEPLTFSSVVIPRGLVRGPVEGYDWTQPANPFLEALGHRPVASNTRIHAALLPRRVARITRLPSRVPFILLVHTVVSEAGVFLLYAHDYYRGDHFSFDVRRSRDGGSPATPAPSPGRGPEPFVLSAGAPNAINPRGRVPVRREVSLPGSTALGSAAAARRTSAVTSPRGADPVSSPGPTSPPRPRRSRANAQ
jgi:GntR family transcriptional regulator